MDLKERTNNENRHPWELSRTSSIIRICRKIMPNRDLLKIADIGAGDRYFAKNLVEELRDQDINIVVYAVDNKYDNTISSEKEILILEDITMLEKNSMDCIIMMDVLEHIQEDEIFLKLMLDSLKEDGILIVTVPAFEILFSSHDNYLKHFRRYSYKGLQELLISNNLKIIESHYFYFSLFIVRCLQVMIKKNKSIEENVGIGMWKYSEKSFITRSIRFVLNIDFSLNSILNKLGVRLPGLSLLAVAIKDGVVIEKSN